MSRLNMVDIIQSSYTHLKDLDIQLLALPMYDCEGVQFAIRNNSKKLVRVIYKEETHFLDPGESMKMILNRLIPELPEIDILNNGVDHD